MAFCSVFSRKWVKTEVNAKSASQLIIPSLGLNFSPLLINNWSDVTILLARKNTPSHFLLLVEELTIEAEQLRKSMTFKIAFAIIGKWVIINRVIIIKEKRSSLTATKSQK